MSEKAAVGLDYSHKNKLILEASSYAEFTHFLFNSGYKLGKIQAGFESTKKLENYSCIILSSPNNSKLTDEEIDVLEEYVKNGGSLLIVSSGGGDYSNKSNLNELTRKFGFEFKADEVSDSMNYVNLQKRPVLTKFTPHVITEQLKKVVFSSACSLNILDFIEDEEDIKINKLIPAGLNSWRKQYDQESNKWIDEDSPRVPLFVACEYFKGKVVGFGSLSMFSSLGREYGFTALDNDILIANIFRWLTMEISEGKVVTAELKMDLYYWAESVVKEQKWESLSDIINLSLKYFKDNFKEIIEKLRKVQEERVKKRKEYEKTKAGEKEAAGGDKILEIVSTRKREDLEDIMSALGDLTGEDYEIEIDTKEDLEEPEEEDDLEEPEEPEEEEEEEEDDLEEDGEESDDDDNIEAEGGEEEKNEENDVLKAIENELIEEIDEETKKIENILADALKEEIEKEQEIIMEMAREEIEKETESKLDHEKGEKIKKELEKSIGKDIQKIKNKILKKAGEDMEKQKELIISNLKGKMEKQSDNEEELNKEILLEDAKNELAAIHEKIFKITKEKMEKDREIRIKLIKEREIKIITENQEFFDDIMDAVSFFDAPDLNGEESKKDED